MITHKRGKSKWCTWLIFLTLPQKYVYTDSRWGLRFFSDVSSNFNWLAIMSLDLRRSLWSNREMKSVAPSLQQVTSHFASNCLLRNNSRLKRKLSVCHSDSFPDDYSKSLFCEHAKNTSNTFFLFVFVCIVRYVRTRNALSNNLLHSTYFPSPPPSSGIAGIFLDLFFPYKSPPVPCRQL